jgi:hypothetical protein
MSRTMLGPSVVMASVGAMGARSRRGLQAFLHRSGHAPVRGGDQP